MILKVVAETPEPDHGETMVRPRPVPKASKRSVSAQATTAPATIASVVAQGDSGRLGCRITVDGEARQEHVVTGHSADQHAQTSCLVKNA